MDLATTRSDPDERNSAGQEGGGGRQGTLTSAWLACALSTAQQAFGHELLRAHDFVAIPSAVSRRSWNLVFDADQARGKYELRRQEALDLDPRLDPAL